MFTHNNLCICLQRSQTNLGLRWFTAGFQVQAASIGKNWEDNQQCPLTLNSWLIFCITSRACMHLFLWIPSVSTSERHARNTSDWLNENYHTERQLQSVIHWMAILKKWIGNTCIVLPIITTTICQTATINRADTESPTALHLLRWKHKTRREPDAKKKIQKMISWQKLSVPSLLCFSLLRLICWYISIVHVFKYLFIDRCFFFTAVIQMFPILNVWMLCFCIAMHHGKPNWTVL